MTTTTKKKKTTTKNQKSTFAKTISSVKKTVRNLTNDNSPAKSTDTLLRKFFIDSLKDMYWAETHLAKALPKMQKAATTTELQAAFADHTKATQNHVKRLDQVFRLIGETARAKKCEAMNGLLKEGTDIIADTEKGTATRDVGLIFAAQKVEHYEIASYGGLTQLAKTLGEAKAADLLAMTLQEEKDTDVLLTEIAEDNVNYDASNEEE